MFKLKEFRLAHSLFQSQMAEILGLTQSAISRLETEKIDLTIAQYNILYDKFGKEDVDAFKVDPNTYVEAIGNKNFGSGVQNNGIQQNTDLVSILKKQAETICDHVRTQDELNKTLVGLLEKLALK